MMSIILILEGPFLRSAKKRWTLEFEITFNQNITGSFLRVRVHTKKHTFLSLKSCRALKKVFRNCKDLLSIERQYCSWKIAKSLNVRFDHGFQKWPWDKAISTMYFQRDEGSKWLNRLFKENFDNVKRKKHSYSWGSGYGSILSVIEKIITR